MKVQKSHMVPTYKCSSISGLSAIPSLLDIRNRFVTIAKSIILKKMWRNEQTQFGSNSKKSSDVDFSIERVSSSGDMTGLAEDTLEDALDRQLNDRFEKKARYQVATSRFSDGSMQSTESVLRCMPGDIECDSTCHCDFPIVKVIEEIDYENLMTKFNATEVDVSVTDSASGCLSASSGPDSCETLLQEPSYESYGGPD